MIYEKTLNVLNKLLELTQRGALRWSEEPDGWFTANVEGRTITFRFLYFEATNQVGADPHTIDLVMPGLNTKQACGTEGFSILLELLQAAFPNWKRSPSTSAFDFLKSAFPNDAVE